MALRGAALTLAVVLSGCARRTEPLSAPVVNDKSVTFPLAQPHALDGESVRALMIAVDDLFPPGRSGSSCESRRESHTYRLIRQDDVIFIYIEANPAYCGRRFPAMDSGAKYAISTDGRILRRVVEGIDEDDASWRLKTPDGGVVTVLAEPGAVPDGGLPD